MDRGIREVGIQSITTSDFIIAAIQQLLMITARKRMNMGDDQET